MLQTIDVQCTPRKLYRLGRKEPNKIRPIKLIMSEKKEKHEIIDKFRLKSRNYKNIFIREDYSSQERDEIRRYVEQAKHRNANETEVRWYVKGCPGTQLHLEKRIMQEKKSKIEITNNTIYILFLHFLFLICLMIVVFGFVSVLCNSLINIALRQ